MRLKLIEARRIVEGNIAQIAAERATDAAIAVLRTKFENYRELVEHNSYQLALTGPHHEFHIALAELTQNAFLTLLVETLLRAVPQGLRESEFTAVGEPEDSLSSEVEIHRAILDAVADRKPAAARSAMEEHMDFEQRLVTQVFRDKTRTY